MDSSTSTHDPTALRSAPGRRTVQPRRGDRGLAMLFLGAVLTIYAVIGVALYQLVGVLL